MNPDPAAFVALGSNLGDSATLVRRAFQHLEAFSARPLRRSSLWRSDPVDCPPGSPPFVNAVAQLSPLPEETPETLLARLQSIERNFGRTPKRLLNEARLLDLDLIAFGACRRHSPELTLPHPRAHLRRFVLAPLAELGGELVFPGWDRTVGEYLASLPPGDRLERLPP